MVLTRAGLVGNGATVRRPRPPYIFIQKDYNGSNLVKKLININTKGNLFLSTFHENVKPAIKTKVSFRF